MTIHPRFNFLGVLFYQGDKAEIEALDIDQIIAFAHSDDTDQFGVYTGVWLWLGAGGGGAVDSVNGQTGTVLLTQDDIPDGTTFVQYALTEQTKLAGIEPGAQVNVNADWNATTGDAEILNKPDILHPFLLMGG